MATTIPQDVLDKDGNLAGIEFYDLAGSFIIFAEWDEQDEQTQENREAFRKWAYSVLKNKGYEVTL
jgi:predicted amino acid racemase